MKMNAWVRTNMRKDDFVAITGSTSGIGYEYAKAFAMMGCNLICISNEADKLVQQKERLEQEHGIDVRCIDADLSDANLTQQVADQLANLPVAILVNNAGFGLKGRFETNHIQDYIDIIAVNVTAPVILSRAVLPQMLAKDIGYIIHVASINAIVPIPFNQVYTATKAFCASYALAMARENKRSNVKFQLVMPGTTKTPFHDRQGATPKNLVMLPEDVVRASLARADRSVCIPNRADKVVAKLVPFLPRNVAMDLAAYMLKKRLGI